MAPNAIPPRNFRRVTNDMSVCMVLILRLAGA
jgi:hypothetical protein